VAGTAALILSKNPDIGLSELKETLRSSTRDIGSPGKDETAGYGIIDTERSLGKITDVGNRENNGANLEQEREKVEGSDLNSSPDLGSFRSPSGRIFKTSLDI